MSEELYQHLAKWRRVLRDLAIEAGIKKFVGTLDVRNNKSDSDLEPSAPENEPDRATDPVQTRKPIPK